MGYEQLKLEIREGLAHLTFDRPEKGNAMTPEMAHELAEAATAITEDPRVRAVLVRGAGSNFCVGGDVKFFAEHAGKDLPLYVRPMATDLHLAITRIAKIGVPVVAAVQGAAAGAGFSFACGCDFVVAAETARFTVAYTKIGLTVDGGASYFLPRIVGMRKAAELVALNPILSAAEAKDLGIVTRVVPADALDAEATKLATTLASGPTQSLKAIKRLLRESLVSSIEEQLENETIEVTEAARRADGVEGITAFAARRTPNFKGE